MKKIFLTIFVSSILFFITPSNASAQCSICTKTTSQLGEKPAKALNGGILYLMATPFTVAIFLGYRWYKNEKAVTRQENN